MKHFLLFFFHFISDKSGGGRAKTADWPRREATSSTSRLTFVRGKSKSFSFHVKVSTPQSSVNEFTIFNLRILTRPSSVFFSFPMSCIPEFQKF